MSFRISLVFLLSYNHGTIFLARTLGILNARTESFCAPRGNALLNCPQGKTYSMACVERSLCCAVHALAHLGLGNRGSIASSLGPFSPSRQLPHPQTFCPSWEEFRPGSRGQKPCYLTPFPECSLLNCSVFSSLRTSRA